MCYNQIIKEGSKLSRNKIKEVNKMKKNKVINFAKNTLKNDRIVVVIPIFVYGINEICKTINNMMNQRYNLVITKGDFTIIMTKYSIENNKCIYFIHNIYLLKLLFDFFPQASKRYEGKIMIAYSFASAVWQVLFLIHKRAI